MASTHLVINHIVIEGGKVLIGATDNDRFNWELEDGHSGGDAKTIVFVELEDFGHQRTTGEMVGLHCHPRDPIRPLVLQHVSKLLNVAWEIYDDNLDRDSANEKYFGVSLLEDAGRATTPETIPAQRLTK